MPNRLVKKQFTYEKINHTWFCAFSRRLDVGLLRQRTCGNHDHDASNHCDYAGATADKPDNDDNDAHGRRLLIANRQALTGSVALAW